MRETIRNALMAQHKRYEDLETHAADNKLNRAAQMWHDLALGILKAIEIVDLADDGVPSPGRYLPSRHPFRNN